MNKETPYSIIRLSSDDGKVLRELGNYLRVSDNPKDIHRAVSEKR